MFSEESTEKANTGIPSNDISQCFHPKRQYVGDRGPSSFLLIWFTLITTGSSGIIVRNESNQYGSGNFQRAAQNFVCKFV